MKKFITTALLAFATIALSTSPAGAQSQPTNYNDGDGFLGFRATGGTGASRNYLLNIGPMQQFRDATPGSTIVLSLEGAGADLSGIFGADWFSRSDLFFAVISGRLVTGGGDPANTLYTSNPNIQPFPRRSSNAQGATTSLTDQLGTSYAGNTSTANSDVGLDQAASDPNSYGSFQPGGANSGGISFQAFNPTNEGLPNETLYLNRIAPGVGATVGQPGQLLGTLNLNSNGDLTFTAVPEPSTYALLAAGAAFVLVASRRRRATKA